MKQFYGFVATLVISTMAAGAQTPAQKPVEFDVVSIKLNKSGAQAGGGGRSLPDGTVAMVNTPIRSVLSNAAPVPVREVTGVPDWVTSERYDITVKPPAGATREQIAEMWRTMFADRMKLKGHVEQREEKGYALVLARSDGRLGPNLKPSAVECLPASTDSPRPAMPPSGAQCGGRIGPTSMDMGRTTMDGLASQLGALRLADGLVTNRTGLTGFFAISMKYAPFGSFVSTTPDRPVDDLPDVYTALQEQLGLKLVADTPITVSVFVVDHIERPTEN